MGDSLNATIAQGWNPGQVIGWAQGMTQLQQQRFNLQQAQLQPAYQAMRQVMATKPNPTWGDVAFALGQAKRLGANTDGMTSNMNEWMAGGGSAADYMRANAMGGMSPFEQGQLVGPSPMHLQTAQGTYYGTTPGMWAPGAGTFQGAGFMGRGVSPEWGAEMVTITDPSTGRQYQVPRGSLWGMTPGVGGPAAATTGPVSSGAPGGLTGDKAQDLKIIAQRESGSDPTALNYVAREDPTAYARGATASGKYQIVNSTWRQGAAWAGVDTSKYPTAMSAPESVQDQVAGALYDHLGTTPWQKGGQDWVRGPGGGYTLQAVAPGTGGGSISPAMQPGGVFLGATAAQPAATPTVPVSPDRPPFQYVPPAPGMGAPGAPGMALPGVVQTPGGPMITPPAPWMGELWGQSAKEYSGDVSRLASLPMRIQPWQSAMSILNANPDLKTGPTSQQWNAWASTLAQWGVQLPSMPADSVTAYQELGKNLARGLVTQNAAMGGVGSPTDMARLENEASMPSTQMTPDTIRQLVARQIGYERFQMARLKYFNSLHKGEDPDQYANVYRQQTNQWLSGLDPVAFGFDNMTNQDVANYEQGLTPAEKQTFRSSVREAGKIYPDVARAGQ